MAEEVDVRQVLDDIREQAEFMAKAKESQRNKAYNAARRELERLDAYNHETRGTWDTAFVHEKLVALRDQLDALAHLDGTQAAALIAQWNWVGVAIQAVEDGFSADRKPS